ncbi:phycobilisome rod-core linker polypeptide [Chroococcidiopsis sp. FACHB-1243]|uniref:phycobilisome rod-core linker polypeptide n=1 Tax=Chroococcidiopsis sp. [FACHB-1243] TaxID=2692781 RepID=UPI001781D05E|nr:phycobilisome rod-core linker polypeptide [Chroococcidiopsis sp. [FACHB-1243]]MBD2304434.1 phycobilisome rod-core linker polypeptide [Chroococcidiopsis sp. [FACHB-1243]]
MSVKASGGSPVTQPQRYHTVPVAVISHAVQQDRCLKNTELQELADFFSSGVKLLEIANTLTQHADEIVLAGANRIFVGGSPMAYLEKPKEKIGLPGSGYYVGEDFLTAARRKAGAMMVKEALKIQEVAYYSNPLSGWLQRLRDLFNNQDPLPGGFRFINVSRYGAVRMKRSLRDLAWFLRYITYAIVAGDGSILSANVRGLRGVIPEDVTEATIVALRAMRRQSLDYFLEDGEATQLVKGYFDLLIAEYLTDKPSNQVRIGVSNDQQGLQLPQSYSMSAEVRPKFVFKQGATLTQKQEAIAAIYRHVFERDVTDTYGFTQKAELESQLIGGNISVKEFVRRLGKSRLYRRLFYEPFTISRAIELAARHFLGRGLSSREEFQTYFDVMTKGGLPALVDAFVDSAEYSDYFGEETVPYLRGLGQEAQECRNWGPQLDLFKYSAPVRKVPQFITLFGSYQKPLPEQHPYGCGNDPLEIQFGAIFPQETRNPHPQPAFFNKDTRRILIGSGAGSPDKLNGHALGKVPGSLGTRVLKLEPVHHANGKSNGVSQPGHQSPSVNLLHHSSPAFIEGAYRQVFGRSLYEGQRQPLSSAESKLLGGEISVREFVRQLAKSKVFRSLYWDSLYVTKAIEYIHRRLMGRPTYGRQEMNRYYDICATRGFYALIDAIIDSPEYLECFGENTVPYERYVTARGYLMRSPHHENQLRRDREAETVPDKYNPRKANWAALSQFVEQPILNQITSDGRSNRATEMRHAEIVGDRSNSPEESLEESYEYSQANDSER